MGRAVGDGKLRIGDPVVTLPLLRQRHRRWTWRAERDGFGWRYVGSRGTRAVTLRRYAVGSGWTEDDYTTRWMVWGRESYCAWAARDDDATGGE